MVFVVYKIELDKYYYYGSTDDIKQRFIFHREKCFNPKTCNRKVYKHMRSIGITKDNFYDKVKPKIICSIRPGIIPRYIENKFIDLDDPYCLNMIKAYVSEEEWKAYNKEYNKKYCVENKEKIKEYQKEYYIQNKEQIKEYRKENKEKIYQSKKRWCRKNPERKKEISNKSRKKMFQYHIDNKTYYCNICNYNGGSKGNLKRHTKTKKHINFNNNY